MSNIQKDTKKRIQLNVRMENEQELYEALRDKAESLNTTISELTLAALKASLGWQIPADAIAMLNKINANESEIRKLKKELEALKKKFTQ